MANKTSLPVGRLRFFTTLQFWLKKKNGEVNISNAGLQEYINCKAGFNMKYKLSSTLNLKYSLNHLCSNRDCQIPVLRMNSDPFQIVRRTHEQVLYEGSSGHPKAIPRYLRTELFIPSRPPTLENSQYIPTLTGSNYFPS